MSGNKEVPIVVLSDGIPPFVMGGMQKHSRLLTEYVARKGQTVILYHYIPPGIETPTEDHIRAQFSVEANAHITIRTFNYPVEDPFPGHYLRAQRKISSEYWTALMKEPVFPRLIYSKGFMAWEILKRRRQLPPATKVAVKFHGMNMFQKQPDWKGEIVKWMLRNPVRWIMNNADYVFSYGGKITEIIQGQLKDPSKIAEMPSGIDSSWLQDESSRKQTKGRLRRLLFIGRWDRLKGLPELYQAIAHKKDLKFEMTIVGPIPEGQRLKDKRLNYLGPVHDSAEMKRVYDAHDVLVCPSISEGMPNVIMEAMARGLAIIATDVGATAVLVDEGVGWLIKPQNQLDLEYALESALDDEKLLEKSELAMNRMKEMFDWNTLSNQFLSWYQEKFEHAA